MRMKFRDLWRETETEGFSAVLDFKYRYRETWIQICYFIFPNF